MTLTRDQREVEDRLRCYLAGLADGQTLAGYCAAKGENTLLREVIRELRGLNYQTVQTESHSNPFLHFVREHTVVLDDQEQEGALATAELVAAYRSPIPTRTGPEISYHALLISRDNLFHFIKVWR